jgi:hypothetical protein
VDIKPPGPNAADPGGEHWGVVRAKGTPVWTRLPGTGNDRQRTEDDTKLTAQVRDALTQRPRPDAADAQPLIQRRRSQRLTPVAAVLQPTADGLPAVRRLIVLPSAAMAGIPLEVLIEPRDPQIASYAPSATVLTYLRKQPHINEKAGLLAPLLLGSVHSGWRSWLAESAPCFPGRREDTLTGLGEIAVLLRECRITGLISDTSIPERSGRIGSRAERCPCTAVRFPPGMPSVPTSRRGGVGERARPSIRIADTHEAAAFEFCQRGPRGVGLLSLPRRRRLDRCMSEQPAVFRRDAVRPWTFDHGLSPTLEDTPRWRHCWLRRTPTPGRQSSG